MSEQIYEQARQAALELCETAGLQKGDLLLSVAGVQVNSFAEMLEEIGRHAPGDHVDISYYRNGKTHATTVTLTNAQGTTAVIRR